MNIGDFQNKKILVMGLGIHGGGLGVANFFSKIGANVTVTDLKTRKELMTSIKQLLGHPRLVLGQHNLVDFLKADLIVKNPGVPAESRFLAAARQVNVPIEMESSLFFMLSPSRNIIGVTGTKGKTTTTLLIGVILEKSGKDVKVAGNLRISMLDLIPYIKKDTWLVLELSSWQLEGLSERKLSPHIAVLTNIYHDHLNRYKTFADYVEAKKNIFKFQKPSDFLITKKDLAEVVKGAKSKVILFSVKETSMETLSGSRLIGLHNLENIACAMETAKIIGINEKVVGEALKDFSVPDRLEEIRILDGVRFVNDTTATAPNAVIAALSSFSNALILICGGADKNLDFSQMAESVNRKVKKVIFLDGSATPKIAKLVNRKLVIGQFSNLRKAVNKAWGAAGAGDVILLSPGCASFGMFLNEFDRGEQFKKIVSELKSKT